MEKDFSEIYFFGDKVEEVKLKKLRKTKIFYIRWNDFEISKRDNEICRAIIFDLSKRFY